MSTIYKFRIKYIHPSTGLSITFLLEVNPMSNTAGSAARGRADGPGGVALSTPPLSACACARVVCSVGVPRWMPIRT